METRIARLSSVKLHVIVALFGVAVAAPALANPVYVIAQHSGKALDVSEVSPRNGQRIHQWDVGGGENQKWNLISRGGGAYALRAQHSGKCLDVQGASPANGAALIQYDCHGGANQLFDIGRDGTIRAKHSGKCLDVAAANNANGTPFLQWDCHGGANQRFALRSAGSPTPGPADLIKTGAIAVAEGIGQGTINAAATVGGGVIAAGTAVGDAFKTVGESRVASCPDGYRNMGLTCYRGPDTYAKGCTTIFKKFSCRSGYTDNGCFCGRGASSLGLSSMSCPQGWALRAGRCFRL